MPRGAHVRAQGIADVIVIGAGMTGLSAAVRLKSADVDVIVVDKARGVGGRMASRRIGDAGFDHGAQFITAKDQQFAAALASWQKAGVVRSCFQSETNVSAENTCWCGTPAMTAVAKHLAVGVETRLEQRVVKLQCVDTHWKVVLANGDSITAKAVLLTPPVPQSLMLLEASTIRLPAALRTELAAVEYQRCITVMAALEAPPSIPHPGFITPQDSPIAWIADNQVKGISTLPAVTIQASDDFSRKHWDHDRNVIGGQLIDMAAPLLGSSVESFQVHGWLYSMPAVSSTRRFVTLEQSPPLILAGDAFVKPRVEGAWRSGQAAVDAILATLQTL